MRCFGPVRVGRLFATICGVSLIASPVASAGSISQFGGGQTVYTETAPETNDVRISGGPGTATIREYGADASMSDGGSGDGCTIYGHVATCTGVTSLQISVGEGDDAVIVASSVPAQIRTTIDGGNGDDNLTGGLAADQISGDGFGAGPPGDDTIGGGDDTLAGDAGDDILRGGPGGDTFDGGADFDTADYSDHAEGVRVDIAAGVANDGSASDGAPGARDDVGASIEGVTGSSKADVLTGNGVDNELHGVGGIDRLTGGAGNDGLEGGNGNDTLIGGLDTDSLSGNQGNDTLNSRDASRDADYCHGGTDSVTADVQDTVAGDCETVNLP